jgi:hypothetical protein
MVTGMQILRFLGCLVVIDLRHGYVLLLFVFEMVTCRYVVGTKICYQGTGWSSNTHLTSTGHSPNI